MLTRVLLLLERIRLKGYISSLDAVLAQLVERLLAKQKAAGSRPAYRTNSYPLLMHLYKNSI